MLLTKTKTTCHCLPCTLSSKNHVGLPTWIQSSELLLSLWSGIILHIIYFPITWSILSCHYFHSVSWCSPVCPRILCVCNYCVWIWWWFGYLSSYSWLVSNLWFGVHFLFVRFESWMGVNMISTSNLSPWPSRLNSRKNLTSILSRCNVRHIWWQKNWIPTSHPHSRLWRR